jgi:hypothetical protein
VPPAPAAVEVPAAVATQARHVAPPAAQILAPVPTPRVPPARVSIAKLLAVVSVAAAIVVVLRLLFR